MGPRMWINCTRETARFGDQVRSVFRGQVETEATRSSSAVDLHTLACSGTRGRTITRRKGKADLYCPPIPLLSDGIGGHFGLCLRTPTVQPLKTIVFGQRGHPPLLVQLEYPTVSSGAADRPSY